MYVHQIVKGAFLFLLKERKILLYQRRKTSHYSGYFGVISGNVEENETYEEAIIREAKEEIGIEIKAKELETAHVMHRIDMEDESMYVFFVAKKWRNKIKNREPQKCSKLIWTPIDNLPDNTIPYVKAAIENYLKKNNFSEYKWQ